MWLFSFWSRGKKHDPYYLSYEKSFEKLTRDIASLQRSNVLAKRQRDDWTTLVWIAAVFGLLLSLAYGHWAVNHSTSTNTDAALRVLLVCAWPVVAYLVHSLLRKVWGFVDRRRAVKLERLEQKLRALITDLKDSTRFEKIHELLSKYDPDYRPLQPVQPETPIARGRIQGTPPPGTPLGRWAAGAGARVLPALDKLATSLVGGDPVLMQQIREAKYESDMLRQSLAAAQERVRALEVENKNLREQLRLPTDEQDFSNTGHSMLEDETRELGAQVEDRDTAQSPVSKLQLTPDSQ